MINFVDLNSGIHFSYPTNDTQDGKSLLYVIQQFLSNAAQNDNSFDHMVLDVQFDILIIRQYLLTEYKHMSFEFAPPGEHNTIAEVERLNLYIHDTMLKVFSNPKIPKASWGYLCIYIGFIASLIPSKSRPDISPYELWYHRKFDFHVTPLLPFWSTVYAHHPADTLIKLQPRGWLTHYLGISPNSKRHCQARLYDPLTKFVLNRRSFKVVTTDTIPSDTIAFNSIVSTSLPLEINTGAPDHPEPQPEHVNYVESDQLVLQHQLSDTVDSNLTTTSSNTSFLNSFQKMIV